MRSLRVGQDWATSLSLSTFMHWRSKWQPTPVFLLGESQGRGSLVGCHLWQSQTRLKWLAAAVYFCSTLSFELNQTVSNPTCIVFMTMFVAFLMSEMVRNLPAMQETWVWSLGWEDTLGKGGNGYPLQYSCLENSMNRGSWWALQSMGSQSQTRLSD